MPASRTPSSARGRGSRPSGRGRRRDSRPTRRRTRAARRRSWRRAPSRARAPRSRPCRPPRPSRSRRARRRKDEKRRSGSSLRREIARIAPKPAMLTWSPVPRCRRRSSRPRGRAGSHPCRRRSPCSRRRTRCTARAAGPRVPSSIETQPAARFGMIWTIENGLTRSGPRSLSWLTHCSNDFSPPMPVATAAPTRSAIGAIFETRVGLGLAGGGQREMREPVHPARRLVVDVVGHLEVLHLAGEVHRVTGRVELRDRACAGRPAMSASRSTRAFPSEVTARCR